MICLARVWMGRRLRRSSLFLGAALVLMGTLVSSCMVPPVDDAARVGPFYKPTNFTGEKELPATLRRVVVLPLAAGNVATSESSAALDPVFITELQKKNRFEVVPLSRADCLQRFQAEEFSSVGTLPAQLMSRLKREYAADAVLFLDLTVYKSYRPLVLGIRAKLATLEDNVRLVWTFDNVYSAAEAPVANSARAHFLESDRGGIPADLTPSVLQSPSQFAAYVASDMFSTLPLVSGTSVATGSKEGGQNIPRR